MPGSDFLHYEDNWFSQVDKSKGHRAFYDHCEDRVSYPMAHKIHPRDCYEYCDHRGNSPINSVHIVQEIREQCSLDGIPTRDREVLLFLPKVLVLFHVFS